MTLIMYKQQQNMTDYPAFPRA